jgi:hypothetical protein
MKGTGLACFNASDGVRGVFEDPERWRTWEFVDEICRNSKLSDLLDGDSEAAGSVSSPLSAAS